MKIKGYCLLHSSLVDQAKFNSKCKRGSKAKTCKHFSYQVPDHVKPRKKRDEGKGTYVHKEETLNQMPRERAWTL